MIRVNNLTKVYRSGTQALDQLSIQIDESEIFALLGPNGAGKSSAIKILTTLSGFDEGEVTVAGFNVDTHPDKVRQSIGYVAQETGVDYFLTGRENLVLQGHLYRMTKKDITTRIDELSEYFSLNEALDNLVSSYSGGMRRKLDIATALIHRPKILFLDEPTLGLDTQSRKSLWEYIEKLNTELGLTILLTTHYLEEADKLSHRVAIINNGKIKIAGNPEELKNQICGDVVSLQFDAPENKQDLSNQLKKLPFVKDVKWEMDKLHLYVSNGATSIPPLIDHCHSVNEKVQNVAFSHPTLDDVFIQQTGSSIDSTQEDQGPQWWEKWAGKGNNSKWAKKWPSENEVDSSSETKLTEKDNKNSNEQWPKEDTTEWNNENQWPKDNNTENHAESDNNWPENKEWQKDGQQSWDEKSQWPNNKN